MPRQVDYYFSLQSPWAYIGHRPFREVAKTHGLKVNHKPVVLIDLFSETGGFGWRSAIRSGSAIGWSNCSAGVTSAA